MTRNDQATAMINACNAARSTTDVRAWYAAAWSILARSDASRSGWRVHCEMMCAAEAGMPIGDWLTAQHDMDVARDRVARDRAARDVPHAL